MPRGDHTFGATKADDPGMAVSAANVKRRMEEEENCMVVDCVLVVFARNRFQSCEKNPVSPML